MPQRGKTLVDEAERDTKLLAERGAVQITEVRDAVGDRPFGTVDKTSEDKAYERLPGWFVLGQAAEFDEAGEELGRAYWRHIRDTFGGPKGAARWDMQCRRLHGKYGISVLFQMEPVYVNALKDLVRRGLHLGTVRDTDEERDAESADESDDEWEDTDVL